jgi:hypothetical protein
MTETRIVQGMLMIAALVLGLVGCPPVPPDDSDGGVGGSATGGSGTGGSAGAAPSVPVCDTVASLPTMGTACSTYGESKCDVAGNRCVCERGYWYCNTTCATSYPTEPAPDSTCINGAACNYPSGVGCQCVNSRWVCTGTSSCPAAANMPMTGEACGGLAGVWCDYPNQNPALHIMCGCTPGNVDASLATWTCMQSYPCPTTQPAYDLTHPCAAGGVALCSYGSTRCKCSSVVPWVCGFGSFIFPMFAPSCPDCE